MKKSRKQLLVFFILISQIISSCHPNIPLKEKSKDISYIDTTIKDGQNENPDSEKIDSSEISPENLLGIQTHTKPYNHFRVKMKKFPSYRGDYNTMDNETFDLMGYDLSNLVLNDKLPELLYSVFDSTTIWPKKMPKEFVPADVIERGKNPGLQVRKLHKKGLTGKGISIGVIDGVILTEHKEFKDSLVYYNHVGPETTDETIAYKERFHGNAVASLLAGKSVGVSPGVKLYYISASSRSKDNQVTYEYYTQAINKLLDLNKHLADTDKIRAISISWGLGEEGILFSEEARKAVKRAVDENVLIFFPGMGSYIPINFCSGADRNPLKDPDNPSSYSLGTWEKVDYNGHKDGILFPMDSRSFASQTGVSDYTWQRQGGWSWVMPYMTGLYAICLQINSSLTIKEFSDALLATSDTITVDNLGSKVPVLLVNPVKLTEYLSRR